MKHLSLIVTAFATAIFAACTSGFNTTPSGLEYKIIIANTDAPQPAVGDIVAIRLTCRNQQGQTVDETPLFKMQLKATPAGQPSVEEGLLMMHRGDSADFRLQARFYGNNQTLTNDSLLTVSVKMVDVISREEYERDREAARIAGEREEDQLLNEYLQKNNIDIEPTMSGLYFIETEKGTGPAPISGKMVAIHYEAYFLNGQSFNSSYSRREPLKFKLGARDVIQGLEEGVARMRRGGRATLIIPSALAYGDQQVGPVPPFATLIFEVWLVGTEE
jgi:FKBP-type peptidyl-prolyl cis-trans isomerase